MKKGLETVATERLVIPYANSPMTIRETKPECLISQGDPEITLRRYEILFGMKKN